MIYRAKPNTTHGPQNKHIHYIEQEQIWKCNKCDKTDKPQDRKNLATRAVKSRTHAQIPITDRNTWNSKKHEQYNKKETLNQTTEKTNKHHRPRNTKS